MNVIKQYAWRSAENYRENNSRLPQNQRGLVIGKSECRKTTVILNLLLQPGWLDIIICMCLERVSISKNTKFLEKVSRLV